MEIGKTKGGGPAGPGDFAAVRQALLACVPRFTPEEQRLASVLYQSLVDGQPVPPGHLARRLGVPISSAAQLLDRPPLRSLTCWDDRRAVIGFGGLSVVPMRHRLVVAGRTLYAWCAWDTLFLPEMLGDTAEVESACPETGEIVCLTVRPQGAELRSPRETAISFLLPGASTFSGDTAKTMACFCHYVFFFASREAGTKWIARHPGTFLLTLEEAFELGRLKNAAQFPAGGNAR